MSAPEVALVLPAEDFKAGEQQLHEARNAILAQAAVRGWAVREHRTRIEATPRMGRLPYLSNEAADTLYSHLHRARVAVVSLQRPRGRGPHILRSPPTGGSLVGRDDYVSLREMSRHKGFFVRLRWDGSPTSWFNAFAGWAGRVHNQGHRDPRSLPLHVFHPQQVRSRDLLHAQGQVDFRQTYGAPQHRNDDRDRSWQDTKVWHGQTELQVAGQPLPTGFHWDVQASNVRLETFRSVWLVLKYANVTPDGHLQNPRKPNVKQLA